MTQEMIACAIGARSQMARTYLERNLEQFADSTREQLISHGLKALKETLSQDKELTIDNTTVGVVGIRAPGTKSKLENFILYEGQEIAPLLEAVESAAGAEGAGEASMEVDS